MLIPIRVVAPNDTAMYTELIYTYRICSDWSVIDSSHSNSAVCRTWCLVIIVPPWGRACTYWGRNLDISCGCALSWHPIGQTSSICPRRCSYSSKPTFPSLVPTGERDMFEAVLPIETVSSADVTNSSSLMKTNSQATERSSSEEVSSAGDSINGRP